MNLGTVVVAGCAGPGANSWPLATFGSFFYHQSTMESCAKAKALADFFYWTQTDSNAVSLADTYPPPVPQTRSGES